MSTNPVIETLLFEKARRRERAERILDIAQELLLKHGCGSNPITALQTRLGRW